MILVDTGPLVAAFDPSDSEHAVWAHALRSLDEEAVTTTPVLTETFHLLPRYRPRMRDLMSLVLEGSLTVARMEDSDLRRCFKLMVRYADAPMDFADASLVVVGERSGIDRVFTIDRRHFSAYRMRRGHRHVPFTVVGPHSKPPRVREAGDPETGFDAPPAPVLHDDCGEPYLGRGGRIAESALRDAREALDRLDRALGT